MKRGRADSGSLRLRQQTNPEVAPMKASHAVIPIASAARPSQSAFAQLNAFLEERRSAKEPLQDVEDFERQLHQLFRAGECEILGHELEKLDVNVPVVEIGGVPHRQVLRCEETYFGAAGPVRVNRSLYSTRTSAERAVCPLELRAGVGGGGWAPAAGQP